MDHDAPSCSVCLTPFDDGSRKPWDLGCGHSFCEACLREAPRSFRTCPECRARASTPHVNISLLRTLRPQPAPPSAPPLPAGGPSDPDGPVTRQRSRTHQQPAQQQQPRPQAQAQAQAPQQQGPPEDLAGQILGRRPARGAGAGAAGANPILAAAALAGSVQQALRQRGPGAMGHHPEVASWKATVWTWLGPLLALIYILSPLDAIPDFIPLIGWVDDALAAVYLAAALYGRLSRAAAGPPR